jgi:hypothetical protein
MQTSIIAESVGSYSTYSPVVVESAPGSPVNAVDLKSFTLCTNVVRVRRERDRYLVSLGLSSNLAEMREKHQCSVIDTLIYSSMV